MQVRTWYVRYHLFSLLLAVAPINALDDATEDCMLHVCVRCGSCKVVRMRGTVYLYQVCLLSRFSFSHTRVSCVEIQGRFIPFDTTRWKT